MIYVAAFLLLTTTVFGLLWLSALRQLDKAEGERDRYWDMCLRAGVLFAAQVAEERGQKKTEGSDAP